MATGKTHPRPLSPHLQVYKKMLSMMASITHRITGAALFFGFLLFIWWLLAAATGPAYFDFVDSLFATWLGQLVLFGDFLSPIEDIEARFRRFAAQGVTWALMYHFLGGIRHLTWDTGHGFDLQVIEWIMRTNVIGSVVLTLLVWIIGYLVR